MISLIPIQKIVFVVLILQTHEGLPNKSGDLQLFNLKLVFINTCTHGVLGNSLANFNIMSIDDLNLMGQERYILISCIFGWISVFISLFEFIIKKILGL